MTIKLGSCRLSISRNSNDVITIELRDRDSGVEFFSGSVTLEDFARAVTGQSELPMLGAAVRGLECLGMMQEVKTELVPIPKDSVAHYSNDFSKIHAEWVAPYETDGWAADVDRSFNGHRSGKGTYKTTFRRWVPKAVVK